MKVKGWVDQRVVCLVSSFVLVALMGCARDEAGPVVEDAPAIVARITTSASEPVEITDDGLPYRNHEARDKSVRKKYFLIAGSGEVANFAEEVLEQRDHLLSLGAKASEIACFYTLPTEESFLQDKEQFERLAPALRVCYPAVPKYVWEQLQDGGKAKDSVYVYVSSHGSPPLTWVQRSYEAQGYLFPLTGYLLENPELDQYFVDTGALPELVGADMEDKIQKIREGKFTVSDLLFTPKNLREAIEKGTEARAQKNIVIQACYSGGFIEAPTKPHDTQTLSGMENTSVMTAARFDRSSFGCDPGGDKTYFGQAYNEAWKKQGKLPAATNWDALNAEVVVTISEMESAFKESLPIARQARFKNSEPMYYSSLKK